MKILYIILALGLLSACARQLEHDSVIAAAGERFDRVSSDMSKQQVLELLGEPSAKDGNLYRWEVRSSVGGHASIRLHFTPDDRIAGITRIGAGPKKKVQ